MAALGRRSKYNKIRSTRSQPRTQNPRFLTTAVSDQRKNTNLPHLVKSNHFLRKANLKVFK
jgi:hypothetical protein